MASVVYLHGFASGPDSRKARWLRDVLPEFEVASPDLNPPELTDLTVGGMAAKARRAVDEARERGPTVLVGSSLGGYVAARLADEPVAEGLVGLVLLAPAFDLRRRWRERVGVGALAAWERDGAIELPGFGGASIRLGWSFYAESALHPPFPIVGARPIEIIHGRRDEVVPAGVSERFVAATPGARLHLVDDDHGLLESLPLIRQTVERLHS